MTILRVDTLSGIGTNGPVFDGDFEFNSQNYVILPKGTTDNRIGLTSTSGALRYNTDSNKVELYDGSQWTEVQSSRPDLNGGARGIFGGGETPGPASTNTIEYITISSTGNSQDFGDLLSAGNDKMSCSSTTRGIFTSAVISPAISNVIDYVTIASTGNAQDFGDLFEARVAGAGCGNQTRGIFMGGDPGVSPNNSDTIDYITIASQGVNAQDFGNLTVAKRQTAACSSTTRGICFGGFGPTNVIEFVTIPTIGNSQDFGDLTAANYGGSGISNSTRGIYGVNGAIQYITISSLGNAINFGNLTSVTTRYIGACSSPTRGVFVGGTSPSSYGNNIEYITISTQGNAVDFGDYGSQILDAVGCSNAHGGL